MCGGRDLGEDQIKERLHVAVRRSGWGLVKGSPAFFCRGIHDGVVHLVVGSTKGRKEVEEVALYLSGTTGGTISLVEDYQRPRRVR